ncbi:MAG: peptidylprolyl isomerase [Bacteroidia bacterium]|nr:peptidylprolyl isomerase [Bacteroidia bacterium]
MLKRILVLSLIISTSGFKAQEVLDKVIGVVGKYPILLSDLQNTMLDEEGSGMPTDKCKTFEMLVFQKLLVAQADHDSVTVSDAEVETELNRRMAYYIQKFGSEEKLEKYYGKRTNVLKDELKADVQEKMISEKMRGKISSSTKLTPAEIRLFYATIPQDSLPLVNSEVELQQLVKKPAYSPQAKLDAREFIESLRQKVISGKSTMAIQARLYSMDPGSAKEGGFIPNVTKGMMDPSFEGVAFSLKNGEVSQVFESSYGYHFIELVQRKGGLIDLRHILIIPKLTNDDYFNCKKKLDSIYTDIKTGKISFEDAVRKYSDDADTKQNAGLMVNPQTASTKFDNETLSQIDQNFIVTLNSMQVGDLSKPMEYNERDGSPAFRVIKLKNRIDPHKANLKEDYQKIGQMATMDKNQKLLKDWIKKYSKTTYIKLDPEYKCAFENTWTISN